MREADASVSQPPRITIICMYIMYVKIACTEYRDSSNLLQDIAQRDA